MLRLWPWLAAICTGLLCTGCFAPFNLWWLCWFALTPLLAAVWFSENNWKRRGLRDMLLGYVAGLAFFWTVFFWLTTVTVFGWFLLAFYMAIYFALWGWLAGALRPREVNTVAAGSPLRHEHGAVGEPSLPKKPWDLTREESPLAKSAWLKSGTNLRLAFLLATAWVAQEWLRSIVFSGWGWNTLGSALLLSSSAKNCSWMRAK